MTPPGLDIDISRAVGAAGGLAPEPPAPTGSALAGQTDLVLASGPQALVCSDMLSAASRADAVAYAKRILPGIIANPNDLAKLGNEAVEEVNALASRMLQEAGKAANIPELTKLTSALDDRVRGFTSKYDRDPKVKEARDSYEKAKGKVLDFARKYRSMLAMLLKDAKGISTFLDGLTADIIDRQGQLARNVEMCNELLAANERAISKIVAHTAIMESARELAVEAMEAIVVDAGDPSPTARAAREQRDQIATMVQQLDVRISEFKQRLFVAWATAPQLRNIRTISYSLGQRLGLLVTLTIPVFKLTVVQWVAVMQADQAAELGDAVADTNELALGAFARASGEILPRVAKAVQAPSMSPEAVLLIAESLSKQAKGFEEAYRYGIAQRAQIEAAILHGARSIAASADEQAAVVGDLIRGAQAPPLQFPASGDLPAVVTENATAVLGR